MEKAIKKLGYGLVVMAMCTIEMIGSTMDVIGEVFELIGCLFYTLSDLLVKLEDVIVRWPPYAAGGKYIKKDTKV